MKVWFPMADTGTGAEMFTVQLANALSQRGIETVITRYAKQIEAVPMILSAIRPPPGTDLIHLNAASACGFLDKGIPAVITGHGAFERADYNIYKSHAQSIYHSTLVRPGVGKAVAKAAAITAVSSWVAEVYRQDYAANKVEVIHNWIDTGLFRPVQKSPTRKILYVGRNAWQKGSHLLPQLAELLGSEYELTCTLLKSEWKGILPLNVRLVGPVAQGSMPDLYSAHDALLVPSITEGFCLAAAEAMSCGLPVFGFRGHGLDDVFGPLVETCGADMLDMKGLASRIVRVFEDKDLYLEISRQSSERVRSCFTEQIALDKYILLYEKSIS